MLDKKVARDILLLVNDPSSMEMLITYVDARILWLTSQLRVVHSWEEVSRLQAAIAELDRFHSLRDEAIKDSK